MSEPENAEVETDGARGTWQMATFKRPVPTSLAVALCVVAILGVQGAGVLVAFALVLVLVLLGVKHGSFRELGFRRPESWGDCLGRTLLYGFLMQFASLVVLEPLLTRWLGSPVDLSSLDGVRGNFVNYVILLAVGIGVGGFIEEFTFRGFVQSRTAALLGNHPWSHVVGILMAAVPFGLAHAYQGATGMITTGLMGAVLGFVYMQHKNNLFYAMGTHAIANVFGITAIYLDVDKVMLSWLA